MVGLGFKVISWRTAVKNCGYGLNCRSVALADTSKTLILWLILWSWAPEPYYKTLGL